MITEVSLLIKSIVNAIDNTVEGNFDSVTQKTFLCDTKWMRVGKIVSNSIGEEYRITGIEYDEWVTSIAVGTATQPLDGTIYLTVPYWITGTRIATNNEWTKGDKNLLNKTPIAWLLETLRQRNFGKGSPVEFDADVRLFFLDETDIKQYYTADHRSNVVYPMEKLADAFIQTASKTTGIKPIDEYEFITFSRFGVEKNDGMFQNILDANLSGVELRVSITKYKENCKC